MSQKCLLFAGFLVMGLLLSQQSVEMQAERIFKEDGCMIDLPKWAAKYPNYFEAPIHVCAAHALGSRRTHLARGVFYDGPNDREALKRPGQDAQERSREHVHFH